MPSDRKPLIIGNIAFVKLANKKGVAVIDASDADLIGRYYWRINNGGYAIAWIEHRMVKMHRFLFGDVNGDIDHLNRDRLDNRRDNLVVCTRSENMRNTHAHIDSCSQFKGVYWHKQRCKWHVQLMSNGKKYSLGLYDSEIDAAHAYDRKAVELGWPVYGLNFPHEYELEVVYNDVSRSVSSRRI